MSTLHSPDPDTTTAISRRTVLGASMLAVPAIAMTTASPAHASSPAQRTVTVTAPSNSVSASGSSQVTVTVTTPAGAALAGSPVSLSGPTGSSFAAADGTTDGAGVFSTTFAVNTPWATPGSIATITAVSDSTTGSGALTVLGANMLLEDGTAKQAPTQFASPIVRAQNGPSTEVVVLQDGTVWTRAQNSDNAFTKVAGITNAADLAISTALEGSFYVLTKDGYVWGWGDNSAGQLGDGTTTDRPTNPVQMKNLSGVTKISAANGTFFALKSDKTLWAIGHNNASGKAGVGAGNGSPIPLTQVINGTDVIDVACEDRGGFLVKTNGDVWAWGRGTEGQIGDNAKVDRTTPIKVPGLTNIASITCSITSVSWTGKTTFAINTSGQVWAWGSNATGAYGNGNTTQSLTPVAIPNLTGIAQITTSNKLVYALKKDGTMLRWGNGASTPATYTPTRPVIRLSNTNTNAGSGRATLITE